MTATDLTSKLNALCDLLGISPAEALEALGKLGETPASKKAPTVNEVVPEVDKLVRAETKRAYKPYWLFLAQEHGDKSLDDIDKPMLEALLLRLEEAPRQSVKRKNWKGGSGAKRSAVHAWRRMWEYAIDKGFTTKNLAQALRMPKRLPNERRGLTRAEVEMIYEVAASTGDDPTFDCVLLRLLLETGCRRMVRSH
jgi:site-specific recombinase XerD